MKYENYVVNAMPVEYPLVMLSPLCTVICMHYILIGSGSRGDVCCTYSGSCRCSGDTCRCSGGCRGSGAEVVVVRY